MQGQVLREFARMEQVKAACQDPASLEHAIAMRAFQRIETIVQVGVAGRLAGCFCLLMQRQQHWRERWLPGLNALHVHCVYHAPVPICVLFQWPSKLPLDVAFLSGLFMLTACVATAAAAAAVVTPCRSWAWTLRLWPWHARLLRSS
jgi:hypothetical protein